MTKSTGIAVALAVVIALAFLFLGSSLFAPFGSTGETAVQNQPLANPDTMETGATELTVTDSTVGTGAMAEAGDTVTVQYVGRLTNGQVFDASANHSAEGFTFVLGAGQVIKGWDMGVAGMKEGGVRTLTIPPSLGYGAQAVGPIPANATLIFEVKLVSVGKQN
jgi:FKBP-type peptidyl-prolyl cis-trans isomerase FkpA